MKKVEIFNSPIYWNSTSEKEEYLSPLGLAYIATSLKNAGIKVELIDAVKNKLSVDDIIGLLNRSTADFIGFNIFTQNYEIIHHIIEKTTFQGVFMIGGQAVKSMYQKIITWNIENRMIIIIGEAELLLPAIINDSCLEKPIIEKQNKEVYCVSKKSVYFPKDLSKIILDRTFLESDIIINHYNQKEVAIVTSRGCSFDCAFCGGAKSLNKDVTIRISPKETIISEIESIIDINPNVECIRILDDLFLRDISSAKIAVEIFSQYNNLSWRGMIHVLSIHKNLEIAHELKASGCQELFIGIESGSERIRKKINKLGKISQVFETIYSLLDSGIDVKGYIIFGFPGENINDFEETYRLAKKIKDFSKNSIGNFRTSVFQFRPYDGTQLYNEIIKKDGIINSIEQNTNINSRDGRSQFNFNSGNYSLVEDKVLNDYILRTQKL